MKTMLLRLVVALTGIALLGLVAVEGPLPRAKAQYNDPRFLWSFDLGRRYLRNTDAATWAEYDNGRLKRLYTERGRNNQYVELYTEDPQPTVVRIYNNRLYWMTGGDTAWRAGGTGGWRDN